MLTTDHILKEDTETADDLPVSAALPALIAPLADEEQEDIADAHTGGYQQIPDTSWWEGEPGAALAVAERSYQPLENDASLTLAAVYRWDRHPCYWLAVTQGSIIEHSAGGERIIEELLIPAAQGGQLGAAALVVGRLAAPITSAHRLKTQLKHRAANQARLDAACLGSLLALYQQHEGISEQELARRLWCSMAALDDISLCLRPDRGEENGAAFKRYVRLVANVAGVPAHLLGAVLGDALSLERDATKL
jgi:hypothetical protein